MAEIDLFERSLAGAFLRLADDVPGTVDAAAVAHRVALEHPPRRARVLSWGNVAIPRPAWVLLLLAGLLVALVGGALLVGSQLQRRLPAVVPPVGQVFECPPGSTPDEPGPVDQSRPADDGAAMAFDRRAGRLVFVTNRRSESTEDISQAAETWTFDVCTNTWTQMRPNREPPRLTDNTQVVYDIDSDVSILFAEPWRRMWAYDLQANTWTEKKAPPTGSYPPAVFLAYDPVSGLVVGAEHSDLKRMWTYDVEGDTWTPISQAPGSDYPVIAYDTSVDRLVAYGDGTAGGPPYETWLFDIRSGTWSRSVAERPAVGGWFVPPALVYDEAAERTVVFMRGPLTAYDASTDRWEILPEARTVGPTLMAYDPVNRRLVGWGAAGSFTLPEGAVEALDLATGEWTVLLEPTPGAATSSSTLP